MPALWLQPCLGLGDGVGNLGVGIGVRVGIVVEVVVGVRVGDLGPVGVGVVGGVWVVILQK